MKLFPNEIERFGPLKSNRIFSKAKASKKVEVDKLLDFIWLKGG